MPQPLVNGCPAFLALLELETTSARTALIASDFGRINDMYWVGTISSQDRWEIMATRIDEIGVLSELLFVFFVVCTTIYSVVHDTL